MRHLGQEALRIDTTGLPLEWIDYKDAASLYAVDQVVYTLGADIYTVFGGINSITGKRSQINVNSIIATNGRSKRFQDKLNQYIPPLNNQTLFKRDAHLCMYCGERFAVRDLSRDHVTPISQKGDDIWTNVVTACRRCNNHKAGRSPEQSSMVLLAVPFTPTHAEYIFLQGRKVLADQMEFLKAHFPRTSPIHERLKM